MMTINQFAKKTFDMSIFEGLDIVNFDETEEYFTVRYEVHYIEAEKTVFMSIVMEGVDELPLLATTPGLVTCNYEEESDVMLVVGDEYL